MHAFFWDSTHRRHGSLNDNHTSRRRKSSKMSSPVQMVRLSLTCVIDLWSLRNPEVRKADEAWRAFYLVPLNSDHERRENSALDMIFFASCSDGRAAYATLWVVTDPSSCSAGTPVRVLRLCRSVHTDSRVIRTGIRRQPASVIVPNEEGACGLDGERKLTCTIGRLPHDVCERMHCLEPGRLCGKAGYRSRRLPRIPFIVELGDTCEIWRQRIRKKGG